LSDEAITVNAGDGELSSSYPDSQLRGDPATDTRPVIPITTDNHVVIDRAIEALADSDDDLFQRAGSLVRVIDAPMTGEIGQICGPRIEAVPTADLRPRLTKVARFTEKKAGRKTAPVHPPRWLIDGVREKGQWSGIRELKMLAEAPVLGPNGTVVHTPGYDAATGVLYRPAGDFPHVPLAPTREDARTAATAICEAVADFPFAGPEHRAAWLAGLLTPIARFAYDGLSPLFLVDANIRGAGKGMLTDVIALIATGRDAPKRAYPAEDEEIRKVITTMLLAGQRLVVFDNISRPLGSDSLDAVLTANVWEDRLLGLNKQVKLQTWTTWYATGNNVVLVNDIIRRTCHIRLNSNQEKPEDRSDFRHPDLLAWVRAERGRLLVAALTILSGYIRAGRPDQNLSPWGNYPEWSALVRSAVVWAGLPDPALTRRELADRSDDEAGVLRGLLAGWVELDPHRKGVTAAEALKRLSAEPEQFETLRNAINQGITGKPLGPQSLGYLMRKLGGRIAGGQCFDSRKNRAGISAWFVKDSSPASPATTNPGAGVAGYAGDNSSLCEYSDSESDIEGGGNIPCIPSIPCTQDLHCAEDSAA
jgi:hypothetical protein